MPVSIQYFDFDEVLVALVSDEDDFISQGRIEFENCVQKYSELQCLKNLYDKEDFFS